MSSFTMSNLSSARHELNKAIVKLKKAQKSIEKECDHIEICVDIASHVGDLQYIASGLEVFMKEWEGQL